MEHEFDRVAVDIQPDPRISTLRPAWLADDDEWRDQLQAMDLDEDIRWIERHWKAAGGAEPAVDTSWLTTETIWSRLFGMDHWHSWWSASSSSSARCCSSSVVANDRP